MVEIRSWSYHSDGDPSAAQAEVDLFRLEINHRLMNTFAILSGILQRERSCQGSIPREAIDRFIEIIHSHAELHRLLAIAGRDPAVQVDIFVEDLCRYLNDAVLNPFNLRCSASTTNGLMLSNQVEWLGMAICELVLNAAKHSSLQRLGGFVEVELQRVGSSWRCSVKDNGRGDASAYPSHGVGSKLVGAIAGRLGGTLKSGPTAAGFEAILDFPYRDIIESEARSL